MKPTLKQKIKLLIEKWEKAGKRAYQELHDGETMAEDMNMLEAVLVDRVRFVDDLKKLIENEQPK